MKYYRKSKTGVKRLSTIDINLRNDSIIMESPKISIITVSYNAAKTIEQTIVSVVNQTYSDIEYIIIDGGSTDGTIDVIKKYENRLAYWISEPDKGIYDAMNKGIDVATGDYVYFLGADDFLANKGVIEGVARYAEKVYSDIIAANVFSYFPQYHMIKQSKNHITLADIYEGWRIPHQGMFTRKNLFNSNNFNLKYKISADYDLFLKFYFDKNIKIHYIEDVVAYFSLLGCSSQQTHKRIYEDVEIMTIHGFPCDKVNQYKSCMDLTVMRFIKKTGIKILEKIGLYKFYLFKKGWRIRN